MENFKNFEKFADIEYRRLDYGAVKKRLKKCLNDFRNARDFQAADDAMKKNEVVYSELNTNSVTANIRHTVNTADKYYEDEMKFINKNSVMLMGINKKFQKALVASPFRKQLAEKYGEIIFKNAEAEIKLQSFWLIPLLLRENKLVMEYSKLVATQSTEFEGEKRNFYGLLKFMESPDRGTRKKAMAAWSKMYEGVAERLEQIYIRLVGIRRKKAKILGFKSFIDMAYLSRNRYDYGPEDVERFREQVRREITPVCDRLAKAQAKRLGVEKLRFYDEKLIFPDGNADPVGTTAELIAKTQKMYREMSAESGEFFDFMVEHGMFDLETKPNKHMGGYCTVLTDYGSPFIFANFNGTAADYGTLTHEAGHCFNMYLSIRHSNSMDTVGGTTEVCEIHSMSMELFALPWAKDYFGDGTGKAVYAHIADSLMGIPYLVSVDEFQHEVFRAPAVTPAKLKEIWRNIEKKYMPWRDYDGDEFLEAGGYWMQKQHIFMYPFYYIDYALAQLSAYEFFGKDKADHKKAWNDYVALCREGGCDTYLNLLKKANLTSPFDEGAVKKAVGYILPELEKTK